MSTPPRQPTEEELRAAYEAELKRITVEDVAVQTTVSLINLAGRRMGLAPGTEDERDLEQVRDAIDAARALMPILERRGVTELRAIRDGLSQLQLAYAKERDRGTDTGLAADSPEAQGSDEPPAEGEPAAPPPGKEGPGPAQSSGRLWVPGQ